MPGTSSNNNIGAPVGLTLKAWALVDMTVANAASALLKGSNIATFVKTGAGVATVTFTSAMGSVNYMVDVVGSGDSASNVRLSTRVTSRLVGGCTVTTDAGATSMSPVAAYFAFYE